MSSNLKALQNLTVGELVAVDKICLHFEDQWIAGIQPEIDEFLIHVDGDARSATLVELVILDIEYRRRNGLPVEPDQYHAIFPNDAALIGLAFAPRSNHPPDEDDNNEKTVNSDNGHVLPVAKVRLESEYEIKELYARGGLGEIYLAHDGKLDRKVAVKFLRNRDPQSQERTRLKREAEVTSRLKHPGIVPVHATSSDEDNTPCYIMKFIDGQTFQEAIEEFHASNSGREKFTCRHFQKLLQHLVSICNTVSYAHDRGVIHRDIKPSNIMVGTFGETFLLDWGLAKVISPVDIHTHKNQNANTPYSNQAESQSLSSELTTESTRPGSPIGTPEFASPEQIQGKIQEQGCRSDVYSLGATLYCLLVGKRPVDAENLVDLASADAIRNIVPPRHCDAKVPSDLDAICMKAVAFDANDRFQSVSELSNELERYVADEPIQTQSESWPTFVRRWLKNNPRKAYSIASGLAVGLLALAISTLILTNKADQLANSLEAQQQLNTELAEAKTSAESYSKKTESALRTLTNRIDQTWFASRKSFSDSEKKMLKDILTQYQEFARLNPNPYFSRTIEAEAFDRVGNIQMLLGQRKNAFDSFNRAINLLDPIPENASESVLMTQANCVHQLGALYCERGEIEEGLKRLQFAFELTESLANELDANAEHLNRMAIIKTKMGSAHLGSKQPELAIEHLIPAREISKNLVDQYPDNDHYRRTYATRMTHLGRAYLQFSKFERSLSEFQTAVALFESTGDLDWIYSGLTRGLEYCAACNGTAYSLAALDRHEEALVAWQKANTAAQRLVKTYPAFPNAYANLAVPTFQSSKRLRKERNWARAIENASLAVKAIEKAVELSSQQRNFVRLRTVIQKELGLILQESGNLGAAEAALRKSVEYARESFELDPEHAIGINGNRLELARTLRRLGQLQVEQNELESARHSFVESIETIESAPEEYLRKSHVERELNDTRDELSKFEH